MFEIKFLKDCEGYEYSSFLDCDIANLCIDDKVETLALVSDGVIYDYGPSVTYSDSYSHYVRISNDSQNHLAFFFGSLFFSCHI